MKQATTKQTTHTKVLPRMLSARDLTTMLGSRALAYRLFNTEGFPKVELGKRMFVREDRFIQWWDEHEGDCVSMAKQAL